ncbi:MAG: efflux RND transporter periplasmic adaptor subunit [Pelotomaculum sp.]|nr:efflux RND transporter periplasmic adaptor subunit [Pelotomaculum sp.]
MSEDLLAATGAKKNKLIVAFLFLAIIALSALIIFSLHRRQASLYEERDSLTATGTVEAKNVTASFKVAGKIEAIFAGEGSRVEEGQELAVLEAKEITAKLNQALGAHEAALAQARQAGESVPLTSQQVETAIDQARAKVAQAEVGLNDARLLYERTAKLWENGAVAQKSYDDAKNNYELAQNRLKEAQAALDQALSARLKVQVAQAQHEAALAQSRQAAGAVQEAQVYLENTRLKAPISGYITQKFAEQGEMVNAGTPVFEITDLEHTYVKVFISEKKIGRVRLGQDAEVTVDSFPGRVFPGKVVWINDAGEFAVRKAVNEQYEHDIRSFEVKIDVPNPDLALKTGMTAHVRILEGR